MDEKRVLRSFLEENRDKLEEPIIALFLKKKENFSLLKDVINNPTYENKEELDQAFRNHYYNVKVINYVSKLIHFYSIDYDKRISADKKRTPIYFEATENPEKLYFNLQSDHKTENIFEETQTALEEMITNQSLYHALQTLNKTQKKVIELIYLNELRNKEIANILNLSEQMVSYYHRTALRKLKSKINLGCEQNE
ncbi:sigma-70 family RNA polymerase sigma factor [Bacillus changyiensis]|uniref:sigma-70 family RNA polymerase sigma factor n=1 Tax=Bacillus changyiensis TaxID=3004103 RepID=UPI0022DEBD77|nr:sigma-70 family RNA polymerase sigma factor [Bacillus changyiensis]MDA1477758.1 sigma-70 family RNA polymerase sigma factor [Bacillus changyiensis]